MQYVGRHYVPCFNHRYQRTGTLWEGRFKSSLVQGQFYLLACHRYIEMNPVRAGLVAAPGDHPRSSYRGNAFGEKDPILAAHAEYLALGQSKTERQTSCQALFASHIDQDLIERTRDCLQSSTPLGTERFRDRVEQMLGRSVGYSKRGRPKTPADERNQKDRKSPGQPSPKGV
jgi:putative transposase